MKWGRRVGVEFQVAGVYSDGSREASDSRFGGGRALEMVTVSLVGTELVEWPVVWLWRWRRLEQEQWW